MPTKLKVLVEKPMISCEKFKKNLGEVDNFRVSNLIQITKHFGLGFFAMSRYRRLNQAAISNATVLTT